VTGTANGYWNTGIRSLIVFALVAACASISAQPKKAPVPAELTIAKTIAIVNETGTQAVLDTATKEFVAWNRYKIVDSKDDADLMVKFTHKNDIDPLTGFMGSIEMEVFAKGSSTPVFDAKHFARFIFQPQLRTKNCVFDFEDRVEGRN